MRIGDRGVFSGVAIVALLASGAAQAQTTTARDYDLAPQSVAATIQAIARISGQNIAAPAELVHGRNAGAVKGHLSAEDALDRALAMSGLRTEKTTGGFVIRPLDAGGATTADRTTTAESATLGDIVVTGSRIRGAPVASPVITLNQNEARNAGQSTVAEVARSIPQNFGGGQNPGIGFNVPATSGVDVGGGASFNLRGLGSDATLTLLNGHRLSYSASRQSVDISAIPLSAVDRIEIVPDGASALYGSDAVAGVANIILRRDYQGLETSARFSASTDGGNEQQAYGAVAGSKWQNGGIIASYEFGRNTPIIARERAYATDRDPTLTFFPALKHHSAVLAGHQALSPSVEFEFDGLYNWRATQYAYPLSATSRAVSNTTAEGFALAPSLKFALPGSDWVAALIGTYGEDRVNFRSDTTSVSGAVSTTINNYRNATRSAEINANGSLFALPGGSAKLAVGTGYRSNSFVNFRSAGSRSNIDASQESTYGFGEINLPVISPEQNIALIDRLNLSAAVRYERYPGIGSVGTPKIGLIYAPTPDFELKGSWGKSFRAPTFLQKYQLQSVYLANPAILGGTGFAPGATALLVIGGNAALKPERATTWGATFVAHPRGLRGARLEIGYFNVHYRDRIVTPIGFLSQSLSNAIYRNQVTLAPSAATVAATVAGGGEFVNISGGTYDPTQVATIVNNSNLNAGRQMVQGVDVLASYRAELGPDAALTFSANASYIESRQQIGTDQPVTQLAGVVFNPPHWRARGTVGWSDHGLTVTGAGTYVGGVDDPRIAPKASIGGMTTFDLTLRYRTPTQKGLFGGLDLSLSVQNIFNEQPDRIRTTLPYDAPYDSTNYSPVGRYISIGITKAW